MAVYNGSNIVIYEGDVALGHTTTATMNLTVDLPDATTKDSGGWVEILAGKRTCKITCEGLIDYSDQMNYNQFVQRIITRKYAKFVFQDATQFFFGGGYINSVEQIADQEAGAKYSVEMIITGPLYFEPRLPWNLVFTNWENVNINWENV
jgi:predicted secreted protein